MQENNNNIEEKNNKPAYIPEKKDNSENTALVFGTIAFIVLFFVGGMILQYAFTYGMASFYQVDPKEVISASTGVDFYNYQEGVREAALVATAWSNFIAYAITLVGLVIILRKYLIVDLKKLFNKEDSKKKIILRLLIIVGMGLVFMGIAIGLDALFSLWTNSSNNQNLIELIVKSKMSLVMIIPTVIFAPIVEELFYRKIAFTFLKRFSIPIAYIGCSLLFALPHMLSTDMSSEWLLQLIPYLLCGGMLTCIYHINKENVYASIIAHMFNNILALILVLI